MYSLKEKVKNHLESLPTKKDQVLADLVYDLGYDYDNAPINALTRNWTEKQKKLVNQVIKLGSHGDFSLIWVRLNSPSILRSAQRTIINLINRQFPYNMIIFSNLQNDTWDFVNMKAVKDKESEEDKEPKKRQILRRIRIDREERLRTAIERISLLEVPEEGIHHFNLQKKHDEAFDVEKVTDAFFNEFKSVFSVFKRHLIDLTNDKEWAHNYGLHFFNRLIFLYFIQKKRWLGDNTEFIKSYWETYKNTEQAKNTFVDKWLSILFFEAFNRSFSHPQWLPKKYREILQMAPFLNGGLFKQNELDKKYSIQIHDDYFEKIFNYLQKYNFTISEDSPIEQEVAVDPEMIGKIFETMTFVEGDVEEAHARGIIYTPRTEIALMCRLALVDRLTNEFGDEHKNRFYELLFAFIEEDKNQIDEQIAEFNLWPKLYRFLQEVTIVDPAVGSGSFLVGMLNILTDLIKRANLQLGNNFTDYQVKKRIIDKSLYGVDVMDWAVHVCELRLWLQLVVETELHPGERILEPLLPNLNLKIRVGDSLVQDVGGVNFSHLRLIELPAHLKGKLTQLIAEKRKFYVNEERRKYRTEREINREELRLFRKILEDQIKRINDRLKIVEEVIEKNEVQMSLYGEKDRIYTSKEKIIEKEKLLLELSRCKEVLGALKDRTDIPFVWNVSFAEIFGEDKHGFDIVIGNPPYVRQELISDPNEEPEDFGGENSLDWKKAKRTYKEKLMHSVFAAFPDFFQYSFKEKKAKRKLDAKNDLYIYFYIHGLSLLNKKGSFCFVTSNSWLDVGYGKDFQEFLIKKVPIKMVIDNNKKRTFSSADINTVICLFGSPWGNKQEEAAAKFVMFYIPFEQCLDPILFEEIEEAQKIKTTPEYRVVPKSADELLKGGIDIEKAEKYHVDVYIGDKWGGKYLRAPDIYYTILEKGKDKLVRLGDIAEVRFGIKTGANEFFYLTQEKIDKWGIEDEFLKPVIKSPRECKTIKIDHSQLKYKLFMCHKKKDELRGTNALKYIEKGEENGFHKRPTCASRNKWYSLGIVNSKIVWPSTYNPELKVFLNYNHYAIDKVFYGVEGDLSIICSLSSYLTIIQTEVIGYALVGGGGLFLTVNQLEDILVINPKYLKIDNFELYDKKESILFSEECGFNKNEPIRSQQPNPLQARKAIDDIVFDTIELTDEERKEVYWTTCELVQKRLEKARSF